MPAIKDEVKQEIIAELMPQIQEQVRKQLEEERSAKQPSVAKTKPKATEAKEKTHEAPVSPPQTSKP